MTNVNPPPQPRLPKQFLNDKEVTGYMRQLQTIIFQLYQRTGGDSDSINEISNIPSLSTNAQIQQLQKESAGLPEFTMDTEGFTMDATEFTMDKVTA